MTKPMDRERRYEWLLDEISKRGEVSSFEDDEFTELYYRVTGTHRPRLQRDLYALYRQDALQRVQLLHYEPVGETGARYRTWRWGYQLSM